MRRCVRCVTMTQGKPVVGASLCRSPIACTSTYGVYPHFRIKFDKSSACTVSHAHRSAWRAGERKRMAVYWYVSLWDRTMPFAWFVVVIECVFGFCLMDRGEKSNRRCYYRLPGGEHRVTEFAWDCEGLGTSMALFRLGNQRL